MRRARTRSHFLALGTLCAIGCVLLCEARAADSPTLVVPASPVALQVVVPLPQTVKPTPGASWQLVEMGAANVVTPVQLLPAMADDGSTVQGKFCAAAIISPDKTAAGPRRFRLRAVSVGNASKATFAFSEISDKSLKLTDGDHPVFVYNHGPITNPNVPQKDSRRSRSCYVHPVWGLDGEVLTDDFPKDHFHHHGLFWAWPHVTVAGKHHDLWSQAVGGVAGSSSDIHDSFVRWICRETGPVAGMLAFENGWFIEGRNVMTERVWLRSFAVSGDARAIDVECTWTPTAAPVTLRGSDGSYGGLSMRFAVRSPKDAVITVPSGQPKDDQAFVRYPWADMTYPFASDGRRSGAALLVDPKHPDYPPAWLLRHYGPLCVSWPGTTERTLTPGKPIRLGYRLWIHRNAVGVDDLRKTYEGYAVGAKAHWE